MGDVGDDGDLGTLPGRPGRAHRLSVERDPYPLHAQAVPDRPGQGLGKGRRVEGAGRAVDLGDVARIVQQLVLERGR